jgi:hypothetical protein
VLSAFMAGHYPLIRSGMRVVCRREVGPIAANEE